MSFIQMDNTVSVDNRLIDLLAYRNLKDASQGKSEGRTKASWQFQRLLDDRFLPKEDYNVGPSLGLTLL